jgi:small-conductance mechanosensitive channel
VRYPLWAALIAALLTLLLPALPGQAAWSQTTEPSQPFRYTQEQWTRTLDNAEQYLQSAARARERLPEITSEVRRVRGEAAEVRAETVQRIETTTRLLTALGEPAVPSEDALPEPPAVTEQRQEFREQLAVLQARLSLTELTIARAEELLSDLSELARSELIERLERRDPVPLVPDTLAVAVPEFLGHMARLIEAPASWYADLTERERATPGLVTEFLLAAGTLLLATLLRYMLLRRFCRYDTEEVPTYARRFVAAISEGVARGIVPASVFGVVHLRLEYSDAAWIQVVNQGLFGTVLTGISQVMFFYLIILEAQRAVLSPEQPNWRLIDLSPVKSRMLSRRIVVLATLIAIDAFFLLIARDLQVSDQLESAYQFVMKSLQAVWAILLARGYLYRDEPLPAAAPGAAPEAATPSVKEMPGSSMAVGGGPSRLWVAVRLMVLLLSVGGIGAMAAGYIQLGVYLISSVISSGLIAGFLILLRALFRESIGLMMRSHFILDRLDLGHGTRRTVKFWLRAALDPLMLLLGVALIAPVWGVPLNDIRRWAGGFLEGFTVGNVTISIVDILLGLLAFLVALVLSRAFQRTLSDRVLPEMELQPGVQHSLSAGAGYVGVIIAFAVAVGVAGFDLTSLAIIAGGLSLGVGIGLQSVVNNFVCGLIMLIERPVNVGDWVVVGQHEGFVKRIAIRATEIETWELASVLIPNSEFINNAVTNLTLTNTRGRIEVRVHVSRECDVARVRDIMLQAANEHPLVLIEPEAFVLFMDFNPSSLEIELRCFTGDVVNKLVIASDIRYRITRQFRAEGIVIPFPQQILWLGEGGEKLTIVRETAGEGGRGAGSPAATPDS